MCITYYDIHVAYIGGLNNVTYFMSNCPSCYIQIIVFVINEGKTVDISNRYYSSNKLLKTYSN